MISLACIADRLWVFINLWSKLFPSLQSWMLFTTLLDYILTASALKPSTVYTASVQLDACIGGAKTSFTFKNKIRTLHRSKIFPSRLTFTEYVQGFVGGQLAMSVVASGEFQRGTRRLKSHTPGTSGLWSECFLPEENAERLYCHAFKGIYMYHVPCVRHFVMNVVK